MPVYLHGISAKNYRGIGPQTQYASPLKECNFFIGTNNSGKSNFLNLIASHIVQAANNTRRGAQLTLNPLEVHLGATMHEVEMGFAVPAVNAFELTKTLIRREVDSLGCGRIIENLLHALAEDGLIWMKVCASNTSECFFSKLAPSEIKKALPHSDWSILLR